MSAAIVALPYAGARFAVEAVTADVVTIRDLGPWDRHLTVTNDAENVVKYLLETGELARGRRLLYYDSLNALDEILVRDGRFIGFAVGPGDEQDLATIRVHPLREAKRAP
jgi:hypothetical protein